MSESMPRRIAFIAAPITLAILSIVLALTASARQENGSPGSPAVVWEYLTVDVTFDGQGNGWEEKKLSLGDMRVRTRTSRVLDHFGAQGWEIVDASGVAPNGAGSNPRSVLFKRRR